MEQQYFIDWECSSSFGAGSPIFQNQESQQMCFQPTYTQTCQIQSQISVSKLQVSTNQQSQVIQGLNQLKTILKVYFKANYQQIQFRPNPAKKNPKQNVIQLKKQQNSSKHLLEKHIHPFFEQCIQKNEFIKLLMFELKLINKKYVIPQIVYIVANIAYQFYFYIEFDISPLQMVGKCKKSAKNLAEKVIHEDKICTVLFRNDDFQEISQRDQTFHQFVLKLALVIWTNSMPKTKEKQKEAIQIQIKNIRQNDSKKEDQKPVSNFLIVDFQSNSAYYTDSQEDDQDTKRTVKQNMTMSQNLYFRKQEPQKQSSRKSSKLSISSLSKFVYNMYDRDDEQE